MFYIFYAVLDLSLIFNLYSTPTEELNSTKYHFECPIPNENNTKNIKSPDPTAKPHERLKFI